MYVWFFSPSCLFSVPMVEGDFRKSFTFNLIDILVYEIVTVRYIFQTFPLTFMEVSTRSINHEIINHGSVNPSGGAKAASNRQR